MISVHTCLTHESLLASRVAV